MTIREGRWDCQYCATQGILGRHKKCPVCASPRPEGTKFYLPEDEPPLVDGKVAEFAKIGPDWICEFCASSNPANASSCHNCFAPREGTSPQQAVKEYALGETPRTGDMDFTEPEKPRPQPASPGGRPPWLWGVAGVLLFLFLCFCALPLGLSLFDQETTVTAVDFGWERTVEVEAYETVVEEDWDVPADGRVLSEQEELRRYDRVVIGYETESRQVSEQVQSGSRDYVCGQRDLGNGFFEDVMCSEPIYETQFRTENVEVPIYEQVPVYDIKYRYEVDKWSVTRTASADGRDQNPAWPSLNLRDNEREGTRTELYRLVFEDSEGNRYEQEFPLAVWQQFERGREYTAVRDAFGNLQEVSP